MLNAGHLLAHLERMLLHRGQSCPAPPAFRPTPDVLLVLRLPKRHRPGRYAGFGQPPILSTHPAGTAELATFQQVGPKPKRPPNL